MKKIIAVALVFAATSAFAVDQAPAPPGAAGQPGPAKPDFNTVKAKIVERINTRIARNQEELACVQAAADHAALKACREKFKEEMRAQHKAMSGQRKGPRPPQAPQQ